MPIWFELVFMLLLTYAAGLAIGGIIWGRNINLTTIEDKDADES